MIKRLHKIDGELNIRFKFYPVDEDDLEVIDWFDRFKVRLSNG